MKHNLTQALLCAGLLALAGQWLCAPTVQAQDASPVTLHVSLFPYLPDAAGDHFQALENRLKTEFEAKHPKINLVLAPLDPASAVFYDLPALEQLLTTNSPTGQADLVETDTLFLGDLITDGVIEPWQLPPAKMDWQPGALSAVTVSGDCYGVPHWLCTFFIFSHLPEVTGAKTAQQFAEVLNTKGTQPTHLAGNFSGSFTLPAIYLDAFVETHGPGTAATGLARAVDKQVTSDLKLVTDQGMRDGKNPCLDGSYRDDKDLTTAVPEFANGKIDAYFGYSERLSYILKANRTATNYTIVPAPLGGGRAPLLYVDALVMRKGLSPGQRIAAHLFVEYLNSPATQEWVTMSKDSTNAPPRYLLPATRSALATPSLRADPYYKQFAGAITTGHPQPTSGYLERKDYFRKEVLAQLSTK